MNISTSGAGAGAASDLPFREVAQHLPTPCWISDAQGSIVWVNAAWLDYTGMDVAAISSQGLEDLHDPAVYPRVAERWRQMLATGDSGEMLFPLRGKDGKLRPFLTRVIPIRNEGGKIVRWFGTNTDVSAQSTAEQLLRESEQRLELATQAAELGIWDWDVVTGAFVYSPRARLICGFSPDEEITYETVAAVTHPDDYPRTSAMAARALDPHIRAAEPYRYRLLRRDGSLRWVEAHGRAVFETRAQGEVAVRYVGTLRDITESVEQLQRGRENEALLHAVFDTSELFIAVVELTQNSFRYLLANKSTLAFYNLPEDTKLFDALQIGIPPVEVQAWREIMLDVWRSGAPRTLEYVFDGGKGPAWYIGTYTPLPEGAEGEQRLSFVVIDITARKLAEERQAALLREVDHRARNALAVAQAVVQLSQPADPKEFKRSVSGRVAALSRAHAILAEERWAGAELRRLLETELRPFWLENTPRLRMEGPRHVFGPAPAQTMGLVFHELAINAATHGALASQEGGLVVTWTVDKAGLHLVWREVGGPGLNPNFRKGFGFTMIEDAVDRSLNGQWRLQPTRDGLICAIDLPPETVADHPLTRPRPGA